MTPVSTASEGPTQDGSSRSEYERTKRLPFWEKRFSSRAKVRSVSGAASVLATLSGSWAIALSVSSSVSRSPEMPAEASEPATAPTTSSRLTWMKERLTLMLSGSLVPVRRSQSASVWVA